MDPAGLPPLQDAIRHLHGAESTWVESVPVVEGLMGQTLWAGEVQVFDLAPGSPAPRCYAWSYETTPPKRSFVAILHAQGIDSAQAAVRAYVVQAARKAKAEKR
jgi:hypothetical protein